MDERLIQDRDYVVVDIETTGGSAVHNRIIEVAAIHYRDGIIYGRYSTLINPSVRIPAWISVLTGIDDHMVRHAPRFEDISTSLMQFLKKGVFVAHNAPFDYRFIKQAFLCVGEDFEVPRLCTVHLARKLYKELPSRSLGVLCEHLLINIEDRHRAYGDAEATVYVLKEMLRVLKERCHVTTEKELLSFLNKHVIPAKAGIQRLS